MRLPFRRHRDVEDRLVWMFGSPRSGSTWLLFVLAEHEGVVPVNEPNLGWHLGPFLSDLPGFAAGALDSTNCMLRQIQDDKSDQFFAREFADAWQPSFAAMMRDRFAAHIERYPPASGRRDRALVLIKEPNGSQSADMIMQALPRARLRFLLATDATWWTPSWRGTSRGRGLEERRLDAIIAKHAFERVPEARRGDKQFFRAATPGTWRRNLTAAEQQQVLDVLGPKLDELGYLSSA